MPDYLYNFTDDNVISVKKAVSGRPKPHALIGIGIGGQTYSRCDFTYRGIWLMETYEVANGFSDADGLLEKYVDAEWDKRQLDYQYEIEVPPDEAGNAIGVKKKDPCRVAFVGEPIEILDAVKVDVDGSGVVTVQLGNAKPDFRKLWESRASAASGYSDYYLWPSIESLSGSATGIKFRDTTHNTCTEATMNFAVPDDVKASNLDRVLLDITLSMSTLQARLHRWGVIVTVDGATNENTVHPNYLLDPSGGISITDMDITDLVTENATNVVKVFPYLHETYWGTDTSCTTHPSMSVSGSMKFYKRLFGP